MRGSGQAGVGFDDFQRAAAMGHNQVARLHRRPGPPGWPPDKAIAPARSIRASAGTETNAPSWKNAVFSAVK